MSRGEPLLFDMMCAAGEALAFVAVLDQFQFAGGRLHQNAVIRSLEVIGEAAGQVSSEFRDAHPEIPRRDIVGMRNRLIHGYSNVSLDTVWTCAGQVARVDPRLETTRSARRRRWPIRQRPPVE